MRSQVSVSALLFFGRFAIPKNASVFGVPVKFLMFRSLAPARTSKARALAEHIGVFFKAHVLEKNEFHYILPEAFRCKARF